jgi:adenylate kinase
MPASVFVISGSPGTGKTSVVKIINEEGFNTMNIYDFAKKYGGIDTYDMERESWIVDTDEVHNALVTYFTAADGVWIIEGHYADIVPEQFVVKVFVLSSELRVLRQRLRDREYSEDKIQENLEAEIMQVCWTDALDTFGESRVVKITNNDISDTAKIIITYIRGDFAIK